MRLCLQALLRKNNSCAFPKRRCARVDARSAIYLMRQTVAAAAAVRLHDILSWFVALQRYSSGRHVHAWYSLSVGSGYLRPCPPWLPSADVADPHSKPCLQH